MVYKISVDFNISNLPESVEPTLTCQGDVSSDEYTFSYTKEYDENDGWVIESSITQVPPVGGGGIQADDWGPFNITVSASGFNDYVFYNVELEDTPGIITLTETTKYVSNLSDGTYHYQIKSKATENKNSAVGATNPIYDWVGTQAEYLAQDIEHQHPEYVCFITDDYTSMFNRDVGEVVMSILPIPNVCLHLLDGSLLSGSGVYSKFVEYIAGLVSDYPDLFVTEVQWQTSVTTYGVCGKFVYDSTNNTVRLPKITGIVEGTTDVTALGDLVQAGLPNITGFTDWWSYGTGTSNNNMGAFFNAANPGVGYAINYSASADNKFTQLLSFDASLSNSIYGNSSTVQPQTIKLFFYLVVSTTVTNDLSIDVADIVETIENTTLKTNQITNCITKIPQDINLELSGTTLTLKAGSKVYIPNGKTGDTLNFTEITLSSDLTYSTWGSASTDLMIFYNNGALAGYSAGMYSGATQPTTAGLWYDTANNYMKYSTNGTSWDISNHALPLGLVGRSSGTPTAIHQVFNGFGYIGSTKFLLPMKGVGTVGKNVDGTYHTVAWEINQVYTDTSSSDINGTFWQGFDLSSDGSMAYFGTYANRNIISPTKPTDINIIWTNPINGYSYYIDANGVVGTTPYMPIRFALQSLSSGKVTSWSVINNTFTALNYWDKNTISSWSMPSSRYIDLTLGASGATYTAPANGWLFLDKSTTGAQYITLQNQTAVPMRASSVYYAGGMYLSVYLPVSKGDVILITYNAAGSTNYFRFYYAQGEN